MLPSNRGCVGFTSEEGLPICLSFRHHANGESGRYSVVSVYDEKETSSRKCRLKIIKMMRSNDIFNRRESSFGIGVVFHASFLCL